MRNKILRSLAIHMLLVWVVLNLNFVLPYAYKVNTWGNYLWKDDGTATTIWDYFLLMYYRPNINLIVYRVFLFIPLVELNYWFFFKKDRLSRGIANAFIIAAAIVIINQLPWDQLRFQNDILYPVSSLLTYAGYAIVYGVVRKHLYEKAYRKELQLLRSENELNALKAQLNPHFFFNGLNYVYGTALNEQAPKTAQAISIMSTMMRYSITGMKENFVPLADELNFINNFLAFQRARLPNKGSIVLDTDIRVDNSNAKIAPLVLLPFIENAFKYGVSIDHPCAIKISINVANGELSMAVTNRIISEHDEVKGNNTGIINTKKRLDLLYQNNYTLVYGEIEKEYKVTLSLKLI